jgi:hypothetical protein
MKKTTQDTLVKLKTASGAADALNRVNNAMTEIHRVALSLILDDQTEEMVSAVRDTYASCNNELIKLKTLLMELHESTLNDINAL